jgi:3',5'-cyclic AMP phosphodiesterase CpdA
MSSILLVHLSDLHFGPDMASQGLSWLPHQGMHDPLLCRGLQDALDDIQQEHKQPLLVAVSGDLTASGDEIEFHIAHTYLLAELRLRLEGQNSRVGLNTNARDFASVPGNHDQWGGPSWRVGPHRGSVLMSGYNPTLSGKHFRATPWHLAWSAPDSSIHLDLFGLDSNSGVGQTFNPLAVGKIDPQELAALENLMKHVAQSGDRVRAIMVHHSLMYRFLLQVLPFPIPPPMIPKELHPDSRQELLRIASEHGVSVILTGHLHDTREYLHQVGLPNGQSVEILEVRCGSTLQSPATSTDREFLVHSISRDPVREWVTWCYRWDGSQFRQTPANSPRHRFAI